MLIEEFSEWLQTKGVCTCHLEEPQEVALFKEFYIETQCQKPSDILPALVLLGKQIHDLQLCVEGLMEDMEELNV